MGDRENMNPSVTPERIMQLAFGYAPPIILEAAIQHHVFDVLDHGPMTLEEVSVATKASQRGLRILMNALVGLSFLEKDHDGRYSLTPESSVFLVSTKPSFYGGLFRHTINQIMPPWLELNSVVQTGKAARVVNQEQSGGEFFSQFVKDIFPISFPLAQTAAQILHIEKSEVPVKVLDLAAGSGVWGIAFALASPLVQITAVDWPAVLQVTRQMAAQFQLQDRLRCIEGDIREIDFGSDYNVATLGNILHSEGEHHSRLLLKKTFNALASQGTIVIGDWLVNQDRTGPVDALIFAVNMLVNTDEGDTFSFEEFRIWLNDAGFENTRAIDAPGALSLVIATKP